MTFGKRWKGDPDHKIIFSVQKSLKKIVLWQVLPPVFEKISSQNPLFLSETLRKREESMADPETPMLFCNSINFSKFLKNTFRRI